MIGGIDIPLTKRVSFRPEEIDRLLSSFGDFARSEFRCSLLKGRSEVASSVMNRPLRKREYARLADIFGDEVAASLTACGYSAGVISVLFTVYPLEQDIEQKVASKDAKRQKYRKRHKDLTRTGVNG